jgi:hypothetical protein
MLNAVAEDFVSLSREDLTSQRRKELTQQLLGNVPALLGRRGYQSF